MVADVSTFVFSSVNRMPSPCELFLPKHLNSGPIKPVLDGVWDFHSEDEEDGWKGAFNRSFSGRAMGKCVVKIV